MFPRIHRRQTQYQAPRFYAPCPSFDLPWTLRHKCSRQPRYRCLAPRTGRSEINQHKCRHWHSYTCLDRFAGFPWTIRHSDHRWHKWMCLARFVCYLWTIQRIYHHCHRWMCLGHFVCYLQRRQRIDCHWHRLKFPDHFVYFDQSPQRICCHSAHALGCPAPAVDRLRMHPHIGHRWHMCMCPDRWKGLLQRRRRIYLHWQTYRCLARAFYRLYILQRNYFRCHQALKHLFHSWRHPQTRQCKYAHWHK